MLIAFIKLAHLFAYYCLRSTIQVCLNEDQRFGRVHGEASAASANAHLGTPNAITDGLQ